MADNTFVTKSWLIGVLLTLVLAGGGVLFSASDSSIRALELKVQEHDRSMARQEAQYEEILRRLYRIELAVERDSPRPKLDPRRVPRKTAEAPLSPWEQQ